MAIIKEDFDSRTTTTKEYKEDTVVALHASKGYMIDGSSVEILLPDTEEMNALTVNQYAVAAILLDQCALEGGMKKKMSMQWLEWANGIKGYAARPKIHSEVKEKKVVFKWEYKDPYDEDVLVEYVRGFLTYLADYDQDKLDEIDYGYISEFFDADVTPEVLLPEIPAVKRIGSVALEALVAGKYSYMKFEYFGIKD